MPYTIEIQGLDKLRKAIERNPATSAQKIATAIRSSVNIIRPLMRTEVPHKSGLLSRNIYARAEGFTGRVGPDLKATPYALFVHEGTRAHEIRPVTKKALFWKGALHPVKRVQHPGTKANPFIERTLEKSKPIVQATFLRAIREITQDLTK